MCPPRLIHHSLIPVAEKVEMYPTKLGIRARLDHPLLYNGLLVVPRVARRRWLRRSGHATQRLRP